MWLTTAHSDIPHSRNSIADSSESYSSMLQWSDLCFVMVGTTFGAIVGAIVGVSLHKRFNEQVLIKAGWTLVGACYCGVLVDIIITHFLSWGFWGFVPAIGMSVSSYVLVLRPLEEECGKWAALMVTIAAAVGSLTASWSQKPMFTILFLTYTGIVISLKQN